MLMIFWEFSLKKSQHSELPFSRSIPTRTVPLSIDSNEVGCAKVTSTQPNRNNMNHHGVRKAPSTWQCMGRTNYRCTRAEPPRAIASTSESLAIVVSPGNVVRSAPWAQPIGAIPQATCQSTCSRSTPTQIHPRHRFDRRRPTGTWD